MKVIKYLTATTVTVITEDGPVLETLVFPVELSWCDTNEEIAKREAYNGEYTIEETPDVEPDMPTQEDRIKELEEALAMLLSGVTE